jgi:hypothetical protein
VALCSIPASAADKPSTSSAAAWGSSSLEVLAPLEHLVDLCLLGGDDVVGDLDQLGRAQPGLLRFTRHLDRGLMVRDHGVDEGAIEGRLAGGDRLVSARRFGRVVVTAAASGAERDHRE